MLPKHACVTLYEALKCHLTFKHLTKRVSMDLNSGEGTEVQRHLGDLPKVTQQMVQIKTSHRTDFGSPTREGNN